MKKYYAYRMEMSKIIPRTVPLFNIKLTPHALREKGRKTRYSEHKLSLDKWVKVERLLNLEEINSFAEISCRAAACPMPFNVDVWDGLICPYSCRYCFANAFRHSLYTSFFDNTKTMGVRHCNPHKYKEELDKLLKFRGKDPHSVRGDIAKAVAMEMPMRFGIRFEDFLKQEAKEGVSLSLLNYLADQNYPVMINTKSDLVAEDRYVDALSRNKGKSAVHITLISSDRELLRKLEPGAPSYERRIKAMEVLVEAGVRVVARIEPWLMFIGDKKAQVKEYIRDVKKAGVKNITFDTYSYTAKSPAIRESLKRIGIDLQRILLTGCDSQAIGSLGLKYFMQLFRDEGFSCSTFDMGNVPDNDQNICCEVGDWFGAGFNYGSSVIAARFIKRRKKPTSWSHFEKMVNDKGGFLSDVLRNELRLLWNCEGSNDAYSHSWAQGMKAVGQDRDGTIWTFDKQSDLRKDIFETIRRKEIEIARQ
jgi:DNA repair photolyase